MSELVPVCKHSQEFCIMNSTEISQSELLVDVQVY